MLKKLFKLILNIISWIKNNTLKKKNKLKKSKALDGSYTFDKYVFDILISFINTSEYYHLILTYQCEIKSSSKYEDRLNILDILFEAMISDGLCFGSKLNKNICESFIYFLKILRCIPETSVNQLDEDTYQKVFSSFQQLT
ncbi:MAG: hypothetical protein H7196_03380 [candidate division SR1 bacterium]|nr:hypothetical protein [candidate division SR1 bacterium]